MSIHANRNSVAGQIEGRPLNMLRSIASTPMSVVAAQLTEYLKTAGSPSRPEADALTFYMLEHAAGIIRAKYGAHDVLPAADLEVLDLYNRGSLILATRAYYYLLLICWREMRHCLSKATTFPAAGEAAGSTAVIMSSFLSEASDTTDMKAISGVWAKASNVTLGQLTKALVYGYRKGKWSSSYGGPKWAVVTECLDSFVWGKTSAAMMLDTVWTLAHNTAPIFNKGMLYSGQDKHILLEILDVQRAGMIPQYITTAKARGYAGAKHVTPDLQVSVAKIAKAVGGVFSAGQDVHWPTVKLLGSKASYGHYADKLKQTDPNPTEVSGLKKALDAKAKQMAMPMQTAPTPAAIIKKLVPGVTVKLGRAQEAA